MTSDYLCDPEIRAVLERIATLARKNREARSDQRASALDSFFWLSAYRGKGKAIHFRPSCAPADNLGDGNWICNLVLRGGGTLGLAHVGFVSGLEQAGIRFAGLAGASAGSIVALGLAAVRGDDLLSSSSSRIAASTIRAPMDWFVDGPRPVRILIKHILGGGSLISPRAWFGVLRAWRRLLLCRGLNHGDRFERWLEAEMTGFGVPTLDVLERQLAWIHDVLAGAEADLDRWDQRIRADGRRVLVTFQARPDTRFKASEMLKLVASAMPIGVKFDLPKHTKYLRLDPARTSPAQLVRMSMAIPGFFDPVRVSVEPATWAHAEVLDYLRDMAGDEKTRDACARIRTLTFIDGGVFSNLPLDAFEEAMPDLPTILVPLVSAPGPERFERSESAKALLRDAGDCIQAMRFQRDTDAYLRLRNRRRQFGPAMRQGPFPRSYNIATAPINTGDANWLDFVMSEQTKRQLFLDGVKAALGFLEDISNGSQTVQGYRNQVPAAERDAAAA